MKTALKATLPMRGRLVETMRERVATGIGAGDVLQARLIERAQFDFVWVSSLAVCAAIGKAENVGMSSSIYHALVEEIVRGVGIPAMIDTNFSDLAPPAVAAAVERYAEMGTAAISIEDKRLPKTNSLDVGSSQVQISVSELQELIGTASSAAKGVVAIVARVESLVTGAGADDALNRMKVAEAAGADLVILHSRAPDPREAMAVVNRWYGHCPVGLIPTTYPSLSVDNLAGTKARFIIYANQLTRSSLQLHEALLSQIKKSGGIHSIGDSLASVEDLFRVVDQKEHRYDG